MAAVRAFIRLSRLKFLAGGFLGVALGIAMAHRAGVQINWNIVILVQIGITSLQLMTHYANEYFDRDADALTVRTPFSGGSGVLTAGDLQPRVAIVAALCCLLAALATLFALAAFNRVPAIGLGACIAAVAWSYSAPPLRLHSRGLGELATALIVGSLVACFAYTALAGVLPALAFISTLPAAFAMFIMMICVEYPDVEADGESGKRNLLVRLGAQSAPTLIALLTTGIVLTVFVAVKAGAPRPLAAVALVALFLSFCLRGRLTSGGAAPGSIALMGVTIFVATVVLSAAAYAVPL